MESNRGVALILALLVLSFLTILGSALLTSATIDIWISDNYKTATQSLYLAEAGIEEAREMLRTTTVTPPQTLISNGSYSVSVINGNNDDVLTLVSTAQIGPTRKTIEVTVQKGKFPSLPGVDAQTDPRLTTVSGLESFVASITRNATDVFNPAAGEAQLIGNYGSPTDYRVAVVNGDVELGPGSGYGMLLVRGSIRVAGNFTWSGLILVIGKGSLIWHSGTTAMINGGIFLAQTLAPDGSLLSTPGEVTADLTPAAVFYDAAAIKEANRRFPYNAIAIRER
jgi:hypothetical protein